MLSDEDIIQHITQTEEDIQEDDENESEEVAGVPSSGVMKDMLDRCIRWYKGQDECTSNLLLLLNCVRNLAAAKRFTSLKQLTLNSFLS